MNQINKFFITVKYVLGLSLAIYTYFFYLILPKVAYYDAALNITFMMFIVFVLVSSYLFNNDFKNYFKKEIEVLFIVITWFLVIFIGYGIKGLSLDNPEYYAFISRNFYYFILIFLFVSLVDNKVIGKMLVSVYIFYFIYGVYLIPNLFEAEKLGIDPLINKNVVGFFILPFVTYLFMKFQKNFKLLITCYIFGSVILFLTGARTSLVAFLFLPVLFVSIKGFKGKMRFFYLTYITIGLISVLIITFFVYPSYEKINTLLTDRVLLWQTYLNYLLENKSMLTGTGYFALPDLMTSIGQPVYIHPHNQFIAMLVLNGLIGLLFYVIFILKAVPKKVNRLNPTDGIIFVLITIQFTEAIMPFFDFIFISFVFIVNLLINKSLHEDG